MINCQLVSLTFFTKNSYNTNRFHIIKDKAQKHNISSITSFRKITKLLWFFLNNKTVDYVNHRSTQSYSNTTQISWTRTWGQRIFSMKPGSLKLWRWYRVSLNNTLVLHFFRQRRLSNWIDQASSHTYRSPIESYVLSKKKRIRSTKNLQCISIGVTNRLFNWKYNI